MSEQHNIVGLARAEPLPSGRVGFCLRFPLAGSPSPRWSHDFRARLSAELTGHAAVGHLRLNEVVRGQEIVLEGVETAEASNIAGAVERAVDCTNRDCVDGEDAGQSTNHSQAQADAVARDVGASQRRPDPDRG